jgi:hypothetical protein
MYELSAQADYLDKLVSPHDVQNIKNSLESPKGVDLVKYSVLKNFLSLQFEKHLGDYCELMHCYPDNHFNYHFYQMCDNKWLKRMKYLLLDGIGTNTKINVNLDIFERFFEPNTKYSFKWRMLSSTFLDHKFKFDQIFAGNAFGYPTKEQFTIRILNKDYINIQSFLKDSTKITDKVRSQFKKVVIHAHGGGFITMNSSSQQNYLRKFANSADCVIFSIDYPIAPLKTYKVILDSVFKAYLFIKVKSSDFHRADCWLARLRYCYEWGFGWRESFMRTDKLANPQQPKTSN